MDPVAPPVINPELPPVPGPTPTSPPDIVGDTTGKPIRRPQTRYAHRRPFRREREVKINVSAGGGIIRWALEQSLEACDAIEALHKALPKDLQAKRQPGSTGTPCLRMGQALYRNWREVDMCKGVENLVNNQLEDWLYGQIGNAAKAAQKRGALPPSLRLAPLRAGRSDNFDLQRALGLNVKFDCR